MSYSFWHSQNYSGLTWENGASFLDSYSTDQYSDAIVINSTSAQHLLAFVSYMLKLEYYKPTQLVESRH